MGETKTLLRMVALALMWGSSFFWIKLALSAFSPLQLVLGRLVCGAAVLMLLCLLRRHRLPAGRQLWGHLTVAAFFHCALPFTLFAYGELSVDSGITGVLNSTTPLWVLVVAPLLGASSRLTGIRAAGLAVGLAGIVLIFAPWQASGLLSWGALACLAAAASYGFAFVYEGRYLTGAGSGSPGSAGSPASPGSAGSPASPLALSGSQMLLSSGFVLLAMPVGGLTPVHPNATAVIAVVALGTGASGIAFALNYQLLATEGAVAASVVGYLLPVVSVLLGSIFLAEPVNPRVLAGMVVVLAGVAMTRLGKRQQGSFTTAEWQQGSFTTVSSRADAGR